VRKKNVYFREKSQALKGIIFYHVAAGLAVMSQHPETAALLRKHGGKTAEELKAEGK
jgi:hypothetical protein